MASITGGVHPVAASGFNADQSIYESARPSYPPAVLELVKREIVPALGAPATASSLSVLDLAAGTGKWTRLLLPVGIGQLVAVEPSPGMRREFLQHPGIVVLDGSATDIPLADASVDVVFVAQAFHWFANVAALTEMHRVLKKDGTVVLIWNLEDRKTSWVARLREAYEKHEAGSPQYRLGLWRRPFEEPEMAQTVSKMFQLPIQERQVNYSVSNTKNAVWQRVLSKSYIAVLGAEQKDELKKDVDHVLAGPDIHWDNQGDDQVLQYPYNTDIVWFKKL
jgi:ubiquinone/menaquinone biosynthesis C-methylase UbiE